MAQQRNGSIALCPECEGPVNLGGKLQVGQRLPCRRCGSTLVIIERKPLELVVAGGSHEDIRRSKSIKKKSKGIVNSSGKKNNVVKEDPQMTLTTGVSLADCPECSATLRFHKNLKIGQLVVCPECDETLEVTSLRPLDLNWANEDPWESEEYQSARHRS